MPSTKIHIFQHVSFEGPAMIAEWAEARGYNLSYTRFHEKPEIPELINFDWLVVMGGPMNVDEHEQYPWLKNEISFIQEAVLAGKVVLGICLGAQLIAKALGSKVYPGGRKEIGWFPVSFSPEGRNFEGLGFLPVKAMVFHWHGDIFDIPEGAVNLASSEVFQNQAFLYNNKVLALQFHCEMNRQAIMTMIENAGDELVPAEFVQPENIILENIQYLSESNRMLFQLLNYLEGKH